MVQLKEAFEQAFERSLMRFQFQNGTIKSLIAAWAKHSIAVFQFQNGTIKRRWLQ